MSLGNSYVTHKFVKISQVTQEKTESPGAFLERLMDVYCTHAPLDPEAPKQQMAVDLAFVNQAVPDIKKKL